MAGKSGSAWKEQLKADIDEAIKNAATSEDCIELIRAKGYKNHSHTAHSVLPSSAEGLIDVQLSR